MNYLSQVKSLQGECRVETKRCSIKITNRADYIDLKKLYNDTKVWDYLGGQRSSQQIENRVTEWINPQENCQYWTVREIVSGAFLGCILLNHTIMENILKFHICFYQVFGVTVLHLRR